jgi:hypothetical protein
MGEQVVIERDAGLAQSGSQPVSDPFRTAILNRPDAIESVPGPHDHIGDQFWCCPPNLSGHGKTGHGLDLDVSFPEDTFRHFDTVDLGEL